MPLPAALDAVRKAGNELVTQGKMNQETLKRISHTLVLEEDW
jgi:hypothetical protein